MRNTDSQLFWPLTKLPQGSSTSYDQAVPIYKMLGETLQRDMRNGFLAPKILSTKRTAVIIFTPRHLYCR